ncbi:MAG: hypothetical protein NTZ77_00035 [Caldiserica bacterium]|nr:hypothetical protein [Caldisericota bacterium]
MESIQDTTLAALVHRVNLREARWQETYVDAMVTYVLLQSQKECRNAADIVKGIQQLHVAPVEIYVTEVEESVARLKASHKIVEGAAGSLRLSDKCQAEATASVREWQQLEAAVRDEWLGSVHAKYPPISPDDLDSLWRSLIDGFVAPVVLSCGAASVRLMGGAAKRTLEPPIDIKRALANSLAGLPETLREAAECSFTAFLDTDGRRRQYLMGLVSLVFNLYSLALPKTALEQVSAKHPLDLTLLLDTNLLYSLLGIDDTVFNQAVGDLVAIARKAKEYSGGKVAVRLRCDESTIAEFCSGLEYRASRWGGVIPSDVVAETANEVCQLDGVLRAYLHQIEETHEQVSMADFVNVKIETLRPYLSSQGVEVVTSLSATAFSQQELDNDIAAWTLRLSKKGMPRGPARLRHDVELWHSVQLSRSSFKTGSTSFLQPLYVLTCDNQFIDFDRWKTEEQLQLEPDKAICMLPTTLFHMLSIFVPRTDDFDRAFLHSLRTPMLGTRENGTEQVAEKIVRTIAAWHSVSREIAVATLSDRVLLSAASKAQSPEDVAGLLNTSLTEQLEALENLRKQDLEKMRGETADAIQLRDGSIQELQKRLNSQNAQVAALQSNFDTVNAQLTQMKVETEISGAAAALRKQRILQALSNGAWSALIGAFAYLILKGYTYATWLSGLERVLVSATCSLGLFLSRYARGPHPHVERKIATWVLTACALVLTVSLWVHHRGEASRVLAVLTALEPAIFLIQSLLWVWRKVATPGKHQDDA